MKKLDPEFLKHVAAECPGFQVRATARAVTRFYNDSFRSFGITAEQFSLLIGIGAAKGTTVVDLAVNAGIDATTLSRNVQVLVKQGLVRAAGGRGRTGKRLSLANSGRELIAAAIPVWERLTAELSSLLGDKKAKSTRRMLVKLAEAADASRA